MIDSVFIHQKKGQAMFGLGYGEIVLVILIIFLLFGAKKLPELARGIGTGIRELRDSLHGFSHIEAEQPDPGQQTKGA